MLTLRAWVVDRPSCSYTITVHRTTGLLPVPVHSFIDCICPSHETPYLRVRWSSNPSMGFKGFTMMENICYQGWRTCVPRRMSWFCHHDVFNCAKPRTEKKKARTTISLSCNQGLAFTRTRISLKPLCPLFFSGPSLAVEKRLGPRNITLENQ